MNRILIVGATGNVGRQVLSQLLAKGTPVRALARNPDTARLPPQVEVARGDLTIPETLDRCLDGIDTVFLVWVAPAATFAPVLERISKRARRIVFLSAPLKTAHAFFQQPNPSRALGEHIERLIETSEIEWTFLRPGMFAANARRWWAPRIRAGDVVRWPHLSVCTAPIDERYIAAVAVRVFTVRLHLLGRLDEVPLIDHVVPVRVRAADSVFNHAAKAIEIEDIEARVSDLERATELAKQTKRS